MTDFVWTEVLTEYALRNLEHSTWAVINPQDILRSIKCIQQGGGDVTHEEFDQIRKDLRVESNDFRNSLLQLELLTESSDGSWYLTEETSRPGFYSGKQLAEIIEDVGVNNPRISNILGHNFTLHARESLPFCCNLMEPGIPKDSLKTVLVDHYVFNQKLNSFKFDILLDNLIKFEVVEETEFGYVVKHAPPALTFYHIAYAYFFLARNKVGGKVDASDLHREVHGLLPDREEDCTVLGFDQFPIEGWGKHQAWMTSESFTRLLYAGLIDPLCIAHVLKTIVQDEENPSQDLAQSTLRQLKKKILDDVKKFKGEPVNLPEVLQEFEVLD